MSPTFLYEPTARVTTKSFFGIGPASFTDGLSSAYLANRASRVNTSTRIYVLHYPYTADDFWWNDDSGESSSTLRANFNSALKSARVSAMFSGHAHLVHQSNWFADKVRRFSGRSRRFGNRSIRMNEQSRRLGDGVSRFSDRSSRLSDGSNRLVDRTSR